MKVSAESIAREAERWANDSAYVQANLRGFLIGLAKWLREPEIQITAPPTDLSGLGLETSDDERTHWLAVYATKTFHEVPMLLRTLRDVARLITAISEARAERDYRRGAHDSAIVRIAQLTAREATARKDERQRAATIIDDRAAIEEGLASRNCGTSAEWRHRHAKEVLEEISAAIRSQS